MRLQTCAVRSSLLFAASLFFFAVLHHSAAAQEKPSAKADEATQAKFPAAKGRASVPASANAQADSENGRQGKAEKDGPDAIRKREEWFHKQRASANGHIPSGAHRQALEHMQRMMEKEGKLIRRANGTVQEVSPLGPALTTAWSPIGPSPTSGGFYSPVTGRITAIAIDPTDATGNTVLIGGAQGGIWRTTNGGTTWAAVGDQNASLAMGSIAFAPSACSALPGSCTVYAGTGEQASIGGDIYYGAGVLKSTDHGQTWTQTCTTPSTTCPFIGPFSDATPFEFFTLGGARISYVSVNPANPLLVLAGAQFGLSGPLEGVYCSADGGGTWANVLAGQMSTFVGFASSTVAFAALGDPFGSNSSGAGANPNGIYKSTNANSCAMTFSALTGATLPPATSIGRIDMGISPNFATDNTVYASIADASINPATGVTNGSDPNLGVWVSTTGGTSWARTNATDICQQQCWYDNVVKVDPQGTAFFGGSAVTDSTGAPIWVERTIDLGTTWSTVIPATTGIPGLPHVDNHAMAFIVPSGAVTVRMYLGNDGGIWRTDDAGATPVVWNNLNDSVLSLTQFYPALSVHPSSPNFAFAGAQDNGSQIYAGTNNWTDDNECGDGTGTAIDNVMPSTVYVTCNGNNIVASGQNGAVGTFAPATGGINLADNADFVPPLVTDPRVANTVYTGTTKVYQSVNEGLSWVALSGDLVNGAPPNFHDLTAMTVAPTNSTVVYAGADTGQVFVATNVGTGTGNFAAVAGQASLPPRRVNAIAVDPADTTGKTAYAAFSGFAFVAGTLNDPTGHLFKTTDGGAHWTDVSCTVANCSSPAVTDLPNTPVNDVVIDPNVAGTLYVGTDIGVFQGTCTTTCTWTTLSTGLPRVAVLSLKLHAASRTLVATTHGRGAWNFLLSNFAFAGPHISSLSVVSAAAGAAGFTLTVTGNGLATPSTGTIQFGGTALAPTGTQSDTSLSGTVTTALISGSGTVQVTVNVGATPSNALTFTVLGAAPTISSPVAPASALVNAVATPIAVTGTGFTSSSTVLMNPDFGGTPIQTTFVSSTQLTATVPASFMATYGSTNSVGVRNPAPGGGTTVTTSTVTLPTFKVIAPAPTNDNFANAMTVAPGAGGAFTDTKDSSGATTETTDPTPGCAQSVPGTVTARSNTIWYKFAPVNDGMITDVDTIGSSYDTVLSLWTGSAGSLTPVPLACNDDINPGIVIQSQLKNLPVTAGTTYYILVSSFGSPDLNPVAFGGKSVFNLTFSATAPSITMLNPTLGAVGASVTITGAGFGGTQGASTVTFNGTAAATPATSWSDTSIVVPVPAGGTTGNVVVTVGGLASNGVAFTVAPNIATLNPTSGLVGASVTITGANFGATQGTSTVTFNGTAAATPATSWSATSIVVPVPTGATTGNVVVTVGGLASNGVAFTVQSFTVMGSTATVTAGMSGMSTITVTPSGGFTGMVTVSCPTALPPGVTCTPPAPINVTSAAAATGNLTVNVAAPAATGATASVMPLERDVYTAGMAPTRGGKGWWLLSAGTGLSTIVLLLLPGRKRYRAAVGLGLICMVSFAAGCGSSYKAPPAPVPVATTTQIKVTSATKGAAGTMFTFTATVTGGTPTDMVQLLDGGVATGAAVAVSGGTATLTTAALSTVGTHAITAHYVGDATYTQASSSGTLNVSVTGSTTIAITTSPVATPAAPPISVTIN